MTNLMLSAFYDNVNLNIGPMLMWVFFYTQIIGWLYVMVKYVFKSDNNTK